MEIAFFSDKFVRDVLVVNSFLACILAIQHVYHFAKAGAIFFDVLGYFAIYLLLAVASMFGAIYRARAFVSVLDAAMMAIVAGAALLLALIFSGPFDGMLRAVCYIVIGLNGAGVCLDLRMLARRPVTDWKVNWHLDRTRKESLFIGTAVIAFITVLAMASFSSFWFSYSVRAPDGTKTRSSFWGTPSLTLVNATSHVNVIDNSTFTISNATLDVDPPRFASNTFAYVESVMAGNGSDPTNYANYTAGTKSYPNGTVFLHAPLQSITNVTVTFRYVSNHAVLQALQFTNATLILNYEGAFIHDPDPFHYITSTYLFQLLDAWDIDFYVNVGNGLDFPHAFNYGSTIPACYETLNWACQWECFVGISLDFEGGEVAIPGGSPGGSTLPPGYVLPDIPFLNLDLLHWYFLNEQNETLFNDAWLAYEGVYAYASYLGYKSYFIIGDESLHEFIDDDMDCHREPVYPRSSNKDVLYGTMSYHESDAEGRYKLYRDCIDQIGMFGDQGMSLLTGWIQSGSSYYTDDQAGLERYIDDCLIAQAAGMVELFHAPLFWIQSKWGDDAIIVLHDALNESPKKTITFQVPGFVFQDYFFFDFLENINRPWIAAAIMIFAGAWILGPIAWHMARDRALSRGPG
nr:hypothetical protein [Candidatus Sigynarchaeum springense]